MFVASFYCYLNYNKKTDFVIDLDNIWGWLGFNQKYNAKYMLEKNFIVDINYKIIAPECSGAKKDTRGGHNKETIMLNIDTFKKYCMKAGTKKSNEIHDYYIKLEEILQDRLQEEMTSLNDISGEFNEMSEFEMEEQEMMEDYDEFRSEGMDTKKRLLH